MNRLLYSIVIVLSIGYQSCSDEFTQQGEEIIYPDVKVYEEIKSNILGIVTDENGQPLSNVSVSIYSKNTTTNEEGIFEFIEEKMDKKGTYILATKSGYHYGATIVFPDRGTVNAKVVMIKMATTREFESNAGASFDFENNGKVIFPADAITNSDKSPYNGKVFFQCTFLDPNNSKTMEILPLGAWNKKSNGSYAFPLMKQAYLMEIRDENNNRLLIKEGKKVDIFFPKRNEASNALLRLSSFSDIRGQWEDQSSVVYKNGQYATSVSHFCYGVVLEDINTVDVCGKVQLSNGNGLPNMRIIAKSNNEVVHNFYTNDLGEFCVVLPKNIELSFEVYGSHACGLLHSYTSPPLVEDTNINPFVLADLDPLLLNVDIVCNTSQVPGAIVALKMNDETYLFKSDAMGKLSKDVSHLGCDVNVNVTCIAMDPINSKSNEVNISLTVAGSYVINVCDQPCDLQGHFEFPCGTDSLKIVMDNGSGNYSYLWEDGIVTQGKKGKIGTIHSVKVTDVISNCTQTFSYEFYYNNVSFYFLTKCQPKIELAISQVHPPYTFLWSTGETTEYANINGPGSYCVTITNSIGCTGTKCITPQEIIDIDNSPINCDRHYFSLNHNSFDQALVGGSINSPNLENLNLFQTGFNFDIWVTKGTCNDIVKIKLPQIDSVSAEGHNISCLTCEDGYIDISLGSQCYECTIGQTKVHRWDSDFEDMTSLNNQHQLPKGQYAVVVENANSGCIIGYKIVTIE